MSGCGCGVKPCVCDDPDFEDAACDRDRDTIIRLMAERNRLREVARIAKRWAGMGLVDYVPEFAKEQFAADWGRVEELVNNTGERQ